ncbi:MAG: flagellar biosynthesis protein FlgE [Gammaproteobacteria bacterium]
MDTAFTGLSAGLAGIQHGLTQLNDAAQRIASGSVDGTSPAPFAGALVDALEAQIQAEASANVVRRIDEVLGTLIDIRA